MSKYASADANFKQAVERLTFKEDIGHVADIVLCGFTDAEAWTGNMCLSCRCGCM